MAKSLEYLKTNYQEFKDCDGTIEFTYIFNDLFDYLNGKSKFDFGCKGPLNSDNFQKWSSDFEFYESYIKDLAHSNGKKVLVGQRKTAFIGFLINMKSVRFLYRLYVQTRHLSYLLTFKFSQDPLETLFSVIRASLGSNNNPTVIQFTAAFKKILLGAANRSRSYFSNCSEGFYKILVQTSPKKCIDTILDNYQHDSEFIDMYLSNTDTNSKLKEDILIYIAGYVQKKIFRKVKCDECKDYLKNKTEQISCSIIELKNNNKARYGLIKPKDVICTIIQECEQILCTFSSTTNILTDKNIMWKLTNFTKQIMLDKKPNFLKEVDDHSTSELDSHRLILIQIISELFYSLRLKHVAGTLKTNVHQVRHILSKMILFKHN